MKYNNERSVDNAITYRLCDNNMKKEFIANILAIGLHHFYQCKTFAFVCFNKEKKETFAQNGTSPSAAAGCCFNHIFF